MRLRLGGRVLDDDSAAIYREFGYRNNCCPEDIRNALKTCPEGEELVLEINSGGGSAYAGLEMYTVLRNAGRETIGEIGSIAASAASIFAMGCTKLRISPVANLMIHRSATYTEGNSKVHGQAKQMLDTIDEGALTAYAGKAKDKCSREKLRSLMEEEAFLTAEEALELGLVDEILFQEDGEALSKAAVAMAKGMPEIMDSLPDLSELRRLKKGGEHSTGKDPENKKEESKLTLDELREQAPELVSRIREEAATAERERISAIDGIAMPGFEDLVDQAKQDPAATAETLAVKIVARQKQQGAEFLKNRDQDAKGSGVNDVEGSDGGSPVDELKSVLDEVFG